MQIPASPRAMEGQRRHGGKSKFAPTQAEFVHGRFCHFLPGILSEVVEVLGWDGSGRRSLLFLTHETSQKPRISKCEK